jgi:transcriptional regulator with XRE-family HTH domain
MIDLLTGTDVERRRRALKLSRKDLADRCGFSTETRIFNIERKDSWKPGNQELLARILDELESGSYSIELVNPDPDDDPEELTFMPLPDDDLLPATMNGHRAPVDIDAGAYPLWDDDLDEEDRPEDFFVLGDEYNDPPTAEWVESAQAFVDEIAATGGGEEVALPKGTQPSLDYLGDGKKLTNSEVSTWLRCRRKWWLAFYRQLIYGQVDYFGPRSIGNRVHRALEVYYRDGTDPRAALEQAIADDWNAIVTQLANRGIDIVDADVSQAKFSDATQLERAMVQGYMEWLAESGEDAKYEPISAEQAVAVPLAGEVAGEHVEVIALGKMDARFRRTSDGATLFVDHKTVSSYGEIRKVLHMDPQMLHYHLLEFLTTGDGEGRCEGALYNMLRKVKRTASATPPFYRREVIHHNPIEIESYRRRLLGAARDISRATRELDAGHSHLEVVYPTSTKACGWDCDFFGICSMFDDGSRVEDAVASLYRVGDPLERYAKDQEGLGI